MACSRDLLRFNRTQVVHLEFWKVDFSMAYNLGQLGRREIEDYPNEPLITIVCGRILKATLESRFKRIGAASPAKGPFSR